MRTLIKRIVNWFKPAAPVKHRGLTCPDCMTPTMYGSPKGWRCERCGRTDILL